jgi:hypothetical protein
VVSKPKPVKRKKLTRKKVEPRNETPEEKAEFGRKLKEWRERGMV